MKTATELQEWCTGAEQQFGDPAAPICQLFFRWIDSLLEYRGDDLVCGLLEGDVHLLVPRLGPPLRFRLTSLDPKFNSKGQIIYAAERITNGVFTTVPSLNIPLVFHGFVVLYDVPEPAPWERRVVLIA